jgi:hypothetical protein
MGRELTKRQSQIWDMKHSARMSLREISRVLNLNYKTVHEHYEDAMGKVGVLGLPKDLPVTVDRHEWRRIEEAEFIDARIRDYLDTYKAARQEGHLRTAVEALNGCHRYMETMIKLQGISAPEKHQVQITVEDLRRQVELLEAEVGPVSEADIVQYSIAS